MLCRALIVARVGGNCEEEVVSGFGLQRIGRRIGQLVKADFGLVGLSGADGNVVHLKTQNSPIGQIFARALRKSIGIEPGNVAGEKAIQSCAAGTVKHQAVMHDPCIRRAHDCRAQPDVAPEASVGDIEIAVGLDAGGRNTLQRNAQDDIGLPQRCRPGKWVIGRCRGVGERVGLGGRFVGAVIDPLNELPGLVGFQGEIVGELPVIRVRFPGGHSPGHNLHFHGLGIIQNEVVIGHRPGSDVAGTVAPNAFRLEKRGDVGRVGGSLRWSVRDGAAV